MTHPSILIADIGGTNARFAIAGQTPGCFDRLEVLQCADYEAVDLALAAYLDIQSIDHLDGICIAAAGPIQNQTIQMTNNHWFINMSELEHKFGTESSRLLNDFEAISYALPQLSEDQLICIGEPCELPTGDNFNLGIIGPGSGLGVGALIRREGTDYSLLTEGGHAGFSPENSFQVQILEDLFKKYNRVSNERLLSGPGLINIYQALCHLDAVPYKDISAGEIGRLAAEGQDEQCSQTLALFFEILGQVAGDVVLTQAAFDGVFIGGGISQRYPNQLLESKFRAGFENKGRHSHLLEATPTWLITETSPGLIGASSYAQRFLL